MVVQVWYKISYQIVVLWFLSTLIWRTDFRHAQALAVTAVTYILLKVKGTNKLFDLLSHSVTIWSKKFSFTQGERGSSVVYFLISACHSRRPLFESHWGQFFFTFFSFIRDIHKLSTRRMIHVLTTKGEVEDGTK